MYLASLFSDIASVVLGLVSLIISVVALIISKKVYVHSSRKFTPKLDFTINKEHELTITHSSQDLFKIEAVHFVMVKRTGFWYSNSKEYVQVPFIVRSKTFRYIENDGKAKEIFVNDNSTGPCAYNLCPYDEAMVNAIERKVYEKYGIDKSKKGYAAPSMQGLSYTIEITYCNKFNDRHSVIYKYEHVHGHGYDKTAINPEELDQLLQQSAIPAFTDEEKLWKYIIKNYKRSF